MLDYLMIVSPDKEIFRREIDGESIRIGRASESDLVLDDPFVSRKHAILEHGPDGWSLLDAGNKVGTFLNEKRITEPTLLQAGDSIRLGKTCLIFNGSISAPVEFVDRPLGNEPDFISIDEIISTPTNPLLGMVTGSTTLSSFSPFPTKGMHGAISQKAARIILEADRELIFHRPFKEILNKIMDFVHQAIGFDRGILFLEKKGELVPEVIRVPAGLSSQPITISRTVTERAFRKRESVRISDALIDERLGQEISVQDHHIRSVMCVPLWNHRKVIGLIYVDNQNIPNQFNQTDLLVLTHLAIVAAVKIECQRLFDETISIRILEKDLHQAAEIQQHLLPRKAPEIPGYLLHGTSLPCLAVGGDTFDFLSLPGGRFGICLGDVAGKGLSAAMLMCTFQASMRALTHLDLPPEETVIRLNRLLYPQIPANRFVTFFLGILDLADHSLRYVNAGHDWPILLRAGGKTDTLPATGVPVGSFENNRYEARMVNFEPEDTLLCYSDGVTEARNGKKDFFGLERLSELFRKNQGGSPSEIIQTIVAEIQQHQSGAPQSDDITMVVLKRQKILESSLR